MKVAAHGHHAGKAWLCICVEVEPPFQNPGSATVFTLNIQQRIFLKRHYVMLLTA